LNPVHLDPENQQELYSLKSPFVVEEFVTPLCYKALNGVLSEVFDPTINKSGGKNHSWIIILLTSLANLQVVSVQKFHWR
jgi:hypothetical protein